jgi:hypothetical protein
MEYLFDLLRKTGFIAVIVQMWPKFGYLKSKKSSFFDKKSSYWSKWLVGYWTTLQSAEEIQNYWALK